MSLPLLAVSRCLTFPKISKLMTYTLIFYHFNRRRNGNICISHQKTPKKLSCWIFFEILKTGCQLMEKTSNRPA